MRDRAAAEPGLSLRSISDRYPVAIPVRAASSRTVKPRWVRNATIGWLTLHDGQRHFVRDPAPSICVERGYLILKRFFSASKTSYSARVSVMVSVSVIRFAPVPNSQNHQHGDRVGFNAEEDPIATNPQRRYLLSASRITLLASDAGSAAYCSTLATIRARAGGEATHVLHGLGRPLDLPDRLHT